MEVVVTSRFQDSNNRRLRLYIVEYRAHNAEFPIPDEIGVCELSDTGFAEEKTGGICDAGDGTTSCGYYYFVAKR